MGVTAGVAAPVFAAGTGAVLGASVGAFFATKGVCGCGTGWEGRGGGMAWARCGSELKLEFSRLVVGEREAYILHLFGSTYLAGHTHTHTHVHTYPERSGHRSHDHTVHGGGARTGRAFGPHAAGQAQTFRHRGRCFWCTHAHFVYGVHSRADMSFGVPFTTTECPLSFFCRSLCSIFCVPLFVRAPTHAHTNPQSTGTQPLSESRLSRTDHRLHVVIAVS